MPKARELVAWFGAAMLMIAWLRCDHQPRVLVDTETVVPPG